VTSSNPPKTVGRTNTTQSCRQEMSRVYRDARRGHLDSLVAHRLVNILYLIVRTIEGTELEARIEALEAKNGIPSP